MEELYHKVMKGKKVTYQLVTEPEPVTVVTLTDKQCITAAGALGLTLLALFERNFKPMKNGSPHLIARKIKTVEQSVLDLFQGCGEAIDPDLADDFCKSWDRTMREMSA